MEQQQISAKKLKAMEKVKRANAELAKELEELGSSIGVVIRCQHEDIFNMMHRI